MRRSAANHSLRRVATRCGRNGAAALLIAAGSFVAAPAQDLSAYAPTPEDRADAPAPHWDRFHDAALAREAIETCLEVETRTGGDQTRCLGLTMDVCLGFAVNMTTMGSIRCAAGESDAWEGVLADAIERAGARMDQGGRAALAESQRKWSAYRDAACGVWGEIFRGGSLARQIAADCRRDATGRRALEAIGYAEALDP